MMTFSPPAVVVIASFTVLSMSPTRYGLTTRIHDTPRLRIVSAMDMRTRSPRGFLPVEGLCCWPVAEV